MFGKALLFSGLIAGGVAAQAPSDPVRADSLHMTLNIPSYQLEVWDGSEKIRSYWVTVGMPEYQTPVGSFAITRIEWNPAWTPPDSKWARNAKPVAPGPGNPMGRAKLQFDDLLYVHGTYRPNELGGAYSHGCVRLKNEDVLDLARLVATRTGAISEDEIARLEKNSRRTRSVRLPYAIPIRIRYGLSEVVAGQQVDLEDPYGWASRAPAAPAVPAELPVQVEPEPAAAQPSGGDVR